MSWSRSNLPAFAGALEPAWRATAGLPSSESHGYRAARRASSGARSFPLQAINLILALCAIVASSPSSRADSPKKLLHLGIDTPEITELPRLAAELDKTPFDGWVFSITSDSQRGQERRFDFTWEGWGQRAYTERELQPTVDALRNARFTRLTDNFIRINTAPGKVDWFDSFDTIVANSRLAGWVAKQGGIKGIFFDPEEYIGKLWDYHEQRDAKTKSFAEYADQARLRGAEVLRAFQHDYPDITILLAFGAPYAYHKEWPAMHGVPAFAACTNDPKKLESFCYGLLPAFIDGMIEAAGPQVRLIDGTEHSYLTMRRREFIKLRRAFQEHVLPLVGDDRAYTDKMRLGFGLWVDAMWHRDVDERGFQDGQPGKTEYAGWSATDFAKNYWQPEELQMAITNALRESDGYVWLYQERVFYLGSDRNVPPPYEQAIRKARVAAGLPE